MNNTKIVIGFIRLVFVSTKRRHSLILQNFFERNLQEYGTISYIKLTQVGNTNGGGRLSMVDLLIKLACFCKDVNNIFNIKKQLI
jgi:hypothetical protein